MSCGCIPIVTNIPSFKKITGDGKYGFLFTPGETDELLKILCDLKSINREEFSKNVRQYFSSKLSYKNIAEDLYNICVSILS
jgi:glycosyltransferase involved in cell wall biosynthesis